MKIFIISILLMSPFMVANCRKAEEFPVYPTPTYWDSAVLLKDLPVDNESKELILNPWDYRQRLGAMKSLILETTAQSPCLFKNDNQNNVLWGLALQFAWQFDSGRHLTKDPSNLPSTGWWTNMNYQLMIVPLLGASAARYPNIPNNLKVLHPRETDGSIFCLEDTLPAQTNACKEVSQALTDWRDFFQSLQYLEQECRHKNLSQEDAFDKLLGVMWQAHTTSIHQGIKVPYVIKSLGYMSGPEQAFGVGWANLVEFIAAAHFHTTFNQTSALQAFLPQRLLTKNDHVPFTSLPPKTNFVVFVIELADKLNEVSHDLILKIWDRAMCSKHGRADAQLLMDEGLDHLELFIPGFFKILADLVRPCDS